MDISYYIPILHWHWIPIILVAYVCENTTKLLPSCGGCKYANVYKTGVPLKVPVYNPTLHVTDYG